MNKRLWKRGCGALLVAATLCFSGCAGQKPDAATTTGETTEPATEIVQKEEKPVPVNFDLENDVLYFGRTYFERSLPVAALG